jgi:hypothetical protein
MRGLLLLVVGCGGAPDVPARLEEIGSVPQLFQDTPAAFDSNDTLVLMDGNSGLRRLNGNRLDVIPGGSQFSFGSMGVDRDGTLLLGSFNVTQLARLEPNDAIVTIAPAPPLTFATSVGTPSGAYYITPSGALDMLMLPAGGTIWVETPRKLDRTLRAADGTIYAVVDGDIVSLAADDSEVIIASCAEFAGGICLDLQLGGTDAAGHVHMTVRNTSDVHILDPIAGTYREVSLPGGLEVDAMAAGAAMTVVIATDPARANQRSLWMLGPGSNQLLRFAALDTSLGTFARVLAAPSGNVFVIADGKLQAVVPE